MEASFNEILRVYSQPLPQANTYIGGAGLDYPTSADLATKLSIPFYAIQNFRVVNGNIECRIDRDYTIDSNTFSNDTQQGNYSQAKDYFIDLDGHFKNPTNPSSGNRTFAYYGGNTSIFRLPGLTNYGGQTFMYSKPHIVFLPKVTTASNYTISNWRYGVNRCYMPLFSSFHTNYSFISYNTNSPKRKGIFYVHPDTDLANPRIVYAISQGATFRKVTDFTPPNSITDLLVDNITATTARVNFTMPTGINTVDFFEVWLEKTEQFNPRDKYCPQVQEVTATGQSITGLTPNTKYKLRLTTVDTFYNGAGMQEFPAFSNEVYFETLAI